MLAGHRDLPKTAEVAFKEPGIALDLIPPGQTIPFTPVPSSATCSVGGRGGQQLVLPQGYIYKFVPDRKGDLSSGQLYALKITQDLGDRTGTAEWIALDRNAVQVNAVNEAAAKGAPGYGDPEDLEIGTSTGDDHRGNHTLFVAISAENRVLAVNLNAPGNAQIVVSDYVRKGVNAPADFDSPDNLALDKSGNLYITEDPGGSAPGKTLGDDVWFAPFNSQSGAQSLPIQRFFSITDCNAEPTGLYMSVSNRTLFVDIQHRGGDGADLSVAIQRLPDVSFSKSGGNK